MKEIVQDFLSKDPAQVEDTGDRVEITVRPLGDREIGRESRPHLLEFRHVVGPSLSHSNVEHLTLGELREVYKKIGAYLEGLA